MNKRKIKNLVFLFLLVLFSSLLVVSFLPTSVLSDNDVLNQTVKAVVCGDDICSLGENSQNCPQDCGGKTFKIDFPYKEIRVMIDAVQEYEIYVQNNGEEDSVYRIDKSDNLKFIQLEDDSIVVKPDEKKSFKIIVNTTDAEESEVFGKIFITNSNKESQVLDLKVFIEPYRLFLESDFSVLGSEFSVDGTFTYFLSLRFFENVQEDVKIKLIANPFSGNQTYVLDEYVIKFTKNFEAFREVNLGSIIKTDTGEYLVRDISFKLQNNTLPADDYLLTMNVITSKGIDVRTDTIKITNFLYEKWYVKYALLLVLFLPIIVVLLMGFSRLKKILRAKQRYVKPIYSQLPRPKNDSIYFEVGKLGDTKKKAYIRANDLLTHGLVAGSTGSGKSVSTSIIIEEALNNKIPVVVFDPTSQWTGFLSPLRDKNILRFYEDFNLKPDDARSYKGLIYLPKDENFEFDIDDCLNPGEVTVFDLSSLSIPQYEKAVYRIVYSLFGKHWEESPDLKLLVVFDEMHRLLDKSCDGSGYQALTKACREFRKWGLGLIMASQIGADFKEAVGGNVLTEVQLNTKNLSDIRNIAKKYSQEYADRVARQGIGVGLVSNPRYNKGMPWFVHFRPPLHDPHKLKEEELQQYDKYTKKLSEIKENISKLSEEEKNNVMLDFKLASDKLREGKFKMAEIYINTLIDYFKKKGK